MRVRSLGHEDPLEREMATHSSILACEIPWTKQPDGLQPMGSQRVGHHWAHTSRIHIYKKVHEKAPVDFTQHSNSANTLVPTPTWNPASTPGLPTWPHQTRTPFTGNHHPNSKGNPVPDLQIHHFYTHSQTTPFNVALLTLQDWIYRIWNVHHSSIYFI